VILTQPIENHPGMETADQMLAQIQLAPDLLGAGPDTGWFAVVKQDAAEGIRKLGQHVLHVHWKDMRAACSHMSCAMGYGVVGLDRVLKVLREINYQGYLSLEHEPEEGHPGPDVARGLEWLRRHDSD
jgi:sugar phosphate isomerase/epimerase